MSLAELEERLAALPEGPRHIVAIAGAPGSGKSTLAKKLGRASGRAVVQMDGFHYDDAVLRERGDLPRKGAPWTFDVDGLAATLKRLRADDAPVAVPVFDRNLEIARAGARIIPPEARIILCEGNYLLLDADGWRDLAGLFGLTVLIDVPFEELKRRLGRRWAAMTPEARRVKLEENDLPNAWQVVTESRPADLTITSAK